MASQHATCLPLFQQAVEDFKKRAGLSKPEIDSFRFTTLTDLKIELGRIEKSQRKSKKLVYLKRLEPFLDAMEQYGKVIGIFVNVSEFVAFVWGPMKLLLIMAADFTNAFNSLLQAYSEIAEAIPLLEQFQSLFERSMNMQKVLATIFEDILEFHREALKYFRKRSWQQLFDATWGPFKSNIAHLVDDLRRHKNIVQSQAFITHAEDTRDQNEYIRTEFQKIAAERAYARTQFQSLQEAEKDRRRFSVQQWLGASDAEARQENARRAMHTGTGQWLLQNDCFLQWFNPNYCRQTLLWMCGKPGAGKTVLASLIIEEARKQPTARTAFFFCKQGDDQRNGFVAVAKAMLRQLLHRNELLLHYLYMKLSEGDPLSNMSNAQELLKTALHTRDPKEKLYIVIDGLDEWDRDNRKHITEWFQKTINDVPPADFGELRCLFISQDDGPARKDLSACSKIKLTVADNRQDIETFCKAQEKEIECKFGALNNPSQSIASLVTARAQGMFLYAKLVTWNLLQQASRADFLKELDPNNLPHGLDEAYDRIVKTVLGSAVNPRRGDRARQMLGWLTCAKRHMKWYEINCAASIDLNTSEVCPDYGFQEDCKSLCGSLVEIGSDETVMLVHSTVRTYLETQRLINKQDVETQLASLCLGYLSFDLFNADKPLDEIQQTLLQGQHSFAEYALCFWPFHLEAALENIDKTSDQFECLKESVEIFLELQWKEPNKVQTVSKTTSEALATFQGSEEYDMLSQAYVSVKNLMRYSGKSPTDDEPLSVWKAANESRAVLEDLSTSSGLADDDQTKLVGFYGENWFKCSRPNCQFFYCGFEKKDQQEQHIAKHDRAFTCTVEGCPQATIGCTTAKDLQEHSLEYHGFQADADEEPEFPPDDDEPASKKSKRGNTGPIQCSLCPKRFTRASNLRLHLRTHTNERPFVCQVCGKGFTRQGDRTRHEEIHSRKPKCRGLVKDGEKWA